MQDLPINKTIWSIIQRLVIGAAVYNVWQERNLRQFKGKSRSIEDVCKIIKEVVKLKLMSLKTSNSKQVVEVAEIWGFHVKKSNKKSKQANVNDACKFND